MRSAFLSLLGFVLLVPLWSAMQGNQPPPTLADRAFVNPSLGVTTQSVRLDEVIDRLPNWAAWRDFLDRREPGAIVRIDPRSGTAATLVLSRPLLPGRGHANELTIEDVGRALGRPVEEVTPDVVAGLTERFVRENRDVLSVDLAELGPFEARQPADDVWQVVSRQAVDGVLVRHARLLATIKYGNLLLAGTEMWEKVRIGTRPRIDAAAALAAGFARAGGRRPEDVLWREPALEILPVTPSGREAAFAPGAPVGGGYDHRLVWTFGFQRDPDGESWEVIVDARSGEVLALVDVVRHAVKKIKGGVYPVTNTGSGNGAMQSGWPMPSADTGLAPPNDRTNSAGVFGNPGVTATTTLSGTYVKIQDACGAISASSTGDIDLGGVNGDHDCAGQSTGNTPAARTSFYEGNTIIGMARGWLPGNAWLAGTQVLIKTNTSFSCGAFYDPSDEFIQFGPGLGLCGNPGEIASIVDHEWGHALDDHDGTPLTGTSDWSEATADVAAIYRHQGSCIGYGQRILNPGTGCGTTVNPAGGYNSNESQTGRHCLTDCSGVRDANYRKHERVWDPINEIFRPSPPDTVQNFVCLHCTDQANGPCGKQVHCATAPVRQAAWDLAKVDLQAAPFSYSNDRAFIVASRLFFQGSDTVEIWHNCDCNASPATSDGCNAGGGYLQWLAVDDNNGNLNDGTPHMTAIYNAFNRHNIACADIAPTNSSCGPSGPAGGFSVTAGCASASLSWQPVGGAAEYWVFRSEGGSLCAQGKTLVAKPGGTSYTDNVVADGRPYCYLVAPAGDNEACYGAPTSCTCVTPLPITGNPNVAVTFPNGGESPRIGTTITLQWNASDSCGGVSSVDLMLSRTGAEGPYQTIASNVPNTGSYNWIVTGPSTSGFTAFLKVVARDPADNTGQDISNAGFKIRCGPCTVTFCRAPGERCTHNNTCGVNGCCNYTCVEDETCLDAEPCPPNSCQLCL